MGEPVSDQMRSIKARSMRAFCQGEWGYVISCSTPQKRLNPQTFKSGYAQKSIRSHAALLQGNCEPSNFCYSLVRSSHSGQPGPTIPPGTVQFTFETRVHCSFASALAKAINRQDERAATVMIRSMIPSFALKSVQIEDYGFTLLFKYPFSTYPYCHLLIREFN